MFLARLPWAHGNRDMNLGGLHIEIRGTVQGVGYRPWVFQLARRMEIRGAVRNDSRGVCVDAFGSSDALERFVIALRSAPPPAARVRSVTYQSIPFVSHSAFAIAGTMAGAERHVSIPADLATCDDCVREMLDPSDRRHRYPFINCTNCGPRYSIVLDSPYDRGKTSMAAFRCATGAGRSTTIRTIDGSMRSRTRVAVAVRGWQPWTT